MRVGGGLVRAAVVVVTGGLLAAGLAAIPAVPAAAGTAIAAPAAPGVPKVADAGTLKTRTAAVANPAASRFTATADTWPAAGSATLSVSEPVVAPLLAPASGLRAALVPAGTAPQLTSAPGVPVVAAATGTATGVQLSVLPHATATAAGVAGVVFTARAAGSSGAQVRVGVSYAGFAQASGGNYGQSLGLEELPACALTTPSVASCRTGRPLASDNDAAAQTVTAVVSLPAAASSSAGVVLAAAPAAAASGDGGAAGTYGATSLKPSSSWSSGGSDGSFTYSYPMAVPPSPGGLEPETGLDYDSGEVDGQTASTQAQSSWVGDGWDTPESFIEQSFASCSDDPEGSAAPQATGDDCYDGPVLTLSLDGTSTPLVCGADFSYTADSTCTESADDGAVVTHHVGSGNGQGSKFTDYWTVTDRDGTTYAFGMNHLPGWASGDPATNSSDTVPVFSAHSGDPCYNATWADSVCTMTYRWHLDWVTDVHANSMAYYYDQDTNAYAENGGTSSAVSYVRDSHLDHIDYGLTGGSAYAQAPDRVSFATGDRCFATSCDSISSNTANWPDVPYTQDHCAAGASCQVTSPTFWSTVRLASVTAAQWNGSSYVTADSWALAQHFPTTGDGTSPALWLDSVTRTGSDTTAGGSAVTLPAVKFAGTEYQNRVDAGNNPALYRYRITGITSETGSVTTINYELTNPCSPGSYPSPASNTSSCFPVYWQQFPNSGSPDWFNKYAVSFVSVSDPTGGSPGTYTSYTYSRPAWHYDDNEVVKAKDRTYGQWRGYGDVKTFTGTGADAQTESETTYYQGMADDNNSTDVTLTDSQGGSHDDLDQLAGQVLESTAYTYAGGPVDHSDIASYWVSAAAATRDRSGLPALTANYTGEVEDWTQQAITDASPGTWRDTETDTSYQTDMSSPDAGLPVIVYAHGDLNPPAGDANQQSCTITTYAAANTSENLAGLPDETRVDGTACGGTSPAGASAPGSGQVNALAAPASLTAAQVTSDTRTYYDDPSLASTWPQPASPAWPQAAPATADVSVTRQATSYDASAGTFTWQTASAAQYNSYGQQTSSWDANGNLTATAYAVTDGSDTGQTVTNPLGQAVTTTLDPLRGIPLTTTDANNVTTTEHYDGLGRDTAVWENGRATTASASATFAYSVSQTAPTYVTSGTLSEGGSYVTTIQIYDALLRPRQTQTNSAQGGSLVSDDFYDSRGWEDKANTSWWASGDGPSGTILTVPDSQVPDQTVTTFDGLGRPVTVTIEDDSSPKSSVFTAYTGDKTTTVTGKATAGSAGGSATTTVTDALGRTTETDDYTTVPAVSTGTNAGGFATVSLSGGAYQATDFSFNPAGLQTGVTDASTGQKWTTSYNMLGQAVAKTDPDTGASQMTYDADGNLTSTTDALGHTLSYTYDPLNRKTGEYDGASDSAPQIASWTYDNSNNAVAGMTDPVGQLTTETSTYGGNTYTFQQAGFNNFGESLGETVTIPAAEGALAGSYTQTEAYKPNTGLAYRTTYPASPLGTGQTTPALPAETLDRTYIPTLDLPSGIGSSLGVYAAATQYNAFALPAKEQIGGSSSRTYLTSSYDPTTEKLAGTQLVNDTVSATPYDATSYTYDPAGDISSETDTRNGTQTEQQCYSYDGLDRLTSAWTTDGTAACPAAPSASTVSDGIPGSAYWTSWTFSPLGNQATQVQHSLTGGADTVTTDTYNNGDGTSSGQPDTLTSAVTAAPGATSSSSWTYDADGQTLTRDVPAGRQDLTWYDDGLLRSDATTSGTSTYVYDGDGNLLLRKDPGQSTLFVFGEQLVLNTSTGAVTGSRFITLPDGGTAVRTGAGSSFSFELSDQQGTSLLTLDNTAASPVWRQETPYGAPRGTAPASWPDDNGFLGKPADTATGLTTLGARQYDPATGRFLSVDPVLDTASPQTMGGYAYAGDNPVTSADPTGLYAEGPGRGGTPCTLANDYSSACGGNGNPQSQTTIGNNTSDPATATPNVVSGDFNTTKQAPAAPPGSTILPPKARAAYAAFYAAYTQSAGFPAGSSIQVLGALAGFCGQGDIWNHGGPCGYGLEDRLYSDYETAIRPMAIDAAAMEMIARLSSLPQGTSLTPEAFANGSAAVDLDTLSCASASFSAGTKVLLADGKSIPIDDVRPGDRVLSYDTATGKDEAATVTAVMVRRDTGLVGLDVTSKAHRATLHTTGNHLVWDATLGRWIAVSRLRAGDQLQSPPRDPAAHISARESRPGNAWMWDLTVAGTHDFYVRAGTTAVLVHNASCSTSGNNEYAVSGRNIHELFSNFLDAVGNGYSGASGIENTTLRVDGKYLDPQLGQEVPIELKPLNDSQWRRATSQIAGYEKAMGVPPGSGQIWGYTVTNGTVMFTRLE